MYVLKDTDGLFFSRHDNFAVVCNSIELAKKFKTIEGALGIQEYLKTKGIETTIEKI